MTHRWFSITLLLGVIVFLISCSQVDATRKGAADTEPPQIVVLLPANGARDVDPSTTELRVTFNEPMKDGNWSWAYRDIAQFPKMLGDPHYEDNRTVNILPVTLEPGRTYVIWLNTEQFQNFKDEYGNTLPPHRWTFTTRAHE